MNGLCLCLFRINVHAACHYGSCSDQLNQLADSVRSRLAEVRVDSLFVSAGSLGSQGKPLGCGSYAVCVEVCGLDYDGLCVSGNFGVKSSHDPCHRYRLLGVIDHQHSVVQCSFRAVQGYEFFSLCGSINDDLVSLQAFDIKGVHRLTVFQHYKVGNVNDVVDGSHARMNQSSL